MWKRAAHTKKDDFCKARLFASNENNSQWNIYKLDLLGGVETARERNGKKENAPGVVNCEWISIFMQKHWTKNLNHIKLYKHIKRRGV